ILLALDLVVFEDAIGNQHFLVHIAKKGELNFDLLGECRVCCWGVHAYPEHRRIVFIDLARSESSLDRLKLLRSTTGKGENVNRKKDVLFAAEIRKLDGLPFIAKKFEVRSTFADLQSRFGDLFCALGT